MKSVYVVIAALVIANALPNTAFGSELQAGAVITERYFMNAGGGATNRAMYFRVSRASGKITHYWGDGWRTGSPDEPDPMPKTVTSNDRLAELNNWLAQIAPGGRSWSPTRSMLQAAGISQSELESALEDRDALTWHENPGRSPIVQISLSGAQPHILFVEFFLEFEGQKNVPVNGAIFRDPWSQIVGTEQELLGTVANVSLPDAEVQRFQSNAVSPDTAAEALKTNPISAVARVYGESLLEIASITIDGEEILLADDRNPNDWLWLNEFAKQDAPLLVLNRLLADRAELGLRRKDVLAATDLGDDSDEVIWTNLGERWAADIKLTGETRLFAMFVEGVPVRLALLNVADIVNATSQWPFEQSADAQRYFEQGDYARCAQAGLGVAEDGQIGPGTNRAWTAWLQERELPASELTNENAGHVCGAFLGKTRPGSEQKYVQRFLFPLTDVGIPGVLESIQADPEYVPVASLDLPLTTMLFEYSSTKVEQASVLGISGLPSMPYGGIYFLSGTYQVAEPWRLLEQLTKRDHALALFNFGSAVLSDFVQEQGGEMVITYDMLRFATDDLPGPDGTPDDVLWSDLGFLADGRRLLAADIGFPDINNLRYVVLFADDAPLAGSLMPGPPP